jgi:hypothetical protein
VLQNTLGITQDHMKRKFMSFDMQKLEKCKPQTIICKIILIESSTNI